MTPPANEPELNKSSEPKLTNNSNEDGRNMNNEEGEYKEFLEWLDTKCSDDATESEAAAAKIEKMPDERKASLMLATCKKTNLHDDASATVGDKRVLEGLSARGDVAAMLAQENREYLSPLAQTIDKFDSHKGGCPELAQVMKAWIASDDIRAHENALIVARSSRAMRRDYLSDLAPIIERYVKQEPESESSIRGTAIESFYFDAKHLLPSLRPAILKVAVENFEEGKYDEESCAALRCVFDSRFNDNPLATSEHIERLIYVSIKTLESAQCTYDHCTGHHKAAAEMICDYLEQIHNQCGKERLRELVTAFFHSVASYLRWKTSITGIGEEEAMASSHSTSTLVRIASVNVSYSFKTQNGTRLSVVSMVHLQRILRVFGPSKFGQLMIVISDGLLKDDDWAKRAAAMVVLYQLGGECESGMIPFLMGMGKAHLNDTHPRVREAAGELMGRLDPFQSALLAAQVKFGEKVNVAFDVASVLREFSKDCPKAVLAFNYDTAVPPLMDALRATPKTDDNFEDTIKAIYRFGDACREKFAKDAHEIFSLCFKGNPKHAVSMRPEKNCIACDAKLPEVIIRKTCGRDGCGACACRPQWCCECLTRILAASNRVKGTCPSCRVPFCVNDVHLLE